MEWIDKLDAGRQAKLAHLASNLVTMHLEFRPWGRVLVAHRGQTVLGESDSFKSVDDTELVRLAFDQLVLRLSI